MPEKRVDLYRYEEAFIEDTLTGSERCFLIMGENCSQLLESLDEEVDWNPIEESVSTRFKYYLAVPEEFLYGA